MDLSASQGYSIFFYAYSEKSPNTFPVSSKSEPFVVYMNSTEEIFNSPNYFKRLEWS